MPHDKERRFTLSSRSEKLISIYSDLFGSGWSCLSSAIAMVTGIRASRMKVGECFGGFCFFYFHDERRQRGVPCVCVLTSTFWLSSLLIANASCSCSSSSPLVWGRACSRSEAARGDEDDAGERSTKQLEGRAREDDGNTETRSGGSVGSFGLIAVNSPDYCSTDTRRHDYKLSTK